MDELGLEQSRLFFEAYRHIPFDLIFISRLKRTRQTIEPFLQLGIPHISTEKINEINWGIHEGKQLEAWMREAYNHMISEWDKGNFEAKLSGGESALELSSRIGSFLDELKLRQEKNILVCTHGRTIKCLMCMLHGEHLREMEKYEHKNTGVFIAELIDDKFHVHTLNEISHLKNLSK